MTPNLSELQKAVLSTVVYFDIFDFPLAALEIFRFLIIPFGQAKTEAARFEETLAAAETMAAQGVLNEKNGWFFLPGREALIETRRAGAVIAERKWKRALKTARFLSSCPFVRFIAVANTLAIGNPSEQSDIDFFVIVRRGRIWLVRFLTAAFLKILRLRPDEGLAKPLFKFAGNGGIPPSGREKTKDSICLSFFLSDSDLSLKRFALQTPIDGASLTANGLLSLPEEDIYLCLWIAAMAPIFDEDDAMNRFWEANAWINNRLNAPQIAVPTPRRVVKPIAPRFKKFLEKVLAGGWGDAADSRAREAQLKRLPARLQDMMNRDTRVVLTDEALKFHANDRREEYRDKFLKKYQEASSRVKI